MLKGVLLFFLWATTGLAVALYCLDFFLDEDGKKKLHDTILRTWYLLAKARDVSIIEQLERNQFWVWAFAIAILCVSFGYFTYEQPLPNSWMSVLWWGLSVILPAFLAFAFLFFIVRLTLKTHSLLVALIAATVFSVAILMPLVLFNALAQPYLFADIRSRLDQPIFLSEAWQLIAFLGLNLGANRMVLLMLVLWLLIVIPITALYVLNGALVAFEFVMRRFAEKPNALLAVAVICTALATMLQNF